MSGESFRVMILRVASTVTVVLKDGSCPSPCQPSSKATRAKGSYRPVAFDAVPRPRRRSRSTAVPISSPAGVEGKGAGGRFSAGESFIAIAPGHKLKPRPEQNKKKYFLSKAGICLVDDGRSPPPIHMPSL